MKAPVHPEETRRLARLRELDGVEASGVEGLDALVVCAARLTGAAIALITLIDESRQWIVARTGIDLTHNPRDDAFCAHALLGSELMEVADLRADPRFSDSPFVTGGPRLRFYAGQPLVIDGLPLGTLCVMDAAPRRLDAGEREILRQLGRAAAELLQSRQREREAARQRERLFDLARAAGDWMWESDAEHRYRWLSGALEPLTGLAPEALLGQHIDDDLLLDERGSPRPGHERLSTLLDRHEPFSRVITAKTTPRGELHISRSAVPMFDEAGRFAGFRGTSRDVSAAVAAASALREHEERWQLAADAAGIGIAQLTLADMRIALDARACRNHGLAHPQLQFLLADWVAQIDAADREAALAGVHRTLASGAPSEGRWRIHRPDGSMRWMEFVLRATRDASGRADGVVGTCRDVHEQHVAADLQRAKQEADRASRAKTQFLSRVSHELRTPLNAILGFAQLMSLDREQPLAGEQAHRLDSVRRAGRHLLGLIDDVLELGRIESNEFALERQPVALDAALAAALKGAQPLAGNAAVTLDAPAPSGLWALGDARAIEQVLMNLLSNAIRFSRRGAHVSVRLTPPVAAGEPLALHVVDSGSGISPAQQARLFQPFERVERGGDERRLVGGTGLGLVIARQLVTAMEGTISVQSLPGAGSTFTVRLSSCAAPASAQASLATALPPVDGPAPLATPRLLYIEDELLNQTLMQEVLRARPGWHLEIAPDGATGLARAQQGGFDLLLIDMNLPDTTGLALIRALRAAPATSALQCIALSADVLAEQIAAARAAGFDDYWTKPIDVRRVLVGLDAALGIRAAA